MKILLLYDTKEKDLARDFQDLLEAFDLEVVMIPRLPDLGKTLQAKEEKYFGEADGAVFLITPGSERDGVQFPSPSVADEMGQAKQRFGVTRDRVVYLVERQCRIQAVDQTSYLSFDRSNMRSVLECVAGLVRNLKASGLLMIGDRRVEPRETPSIDIAEVAKATPELLGRICVELSKLRNGVALDGDFTKLLTEKFALSMQDANFATRDIRLSGLVNYMTAQPPANFGFFALTPIGWELVRYEKKRQGPGLLRLLQGQKRG